MINFVIVSPGEMPPRILVKKGEKWIKHVYCDGARFHVLSWMLVNSKGVVICSAPDCIYNKPEAE